MCFLEGHCFLVRKQCLFRKLIVYFLHINTYTGRVRKPCRAVKRNASVRSPTDAASKATVNAPDWWGRIVVAGVTTRTQAQPVIGGGMTVSGRRYDGLRKMTVRGVSRS